jgi:hypothetical protein
MPRLCLLALLACSDPKGSDSGGAPEPLSGDLILEDQHNYTYSGELAVQGVEVAWGQDVTVDWSSFTVDLRGRPVEPAALDQLGLVAFGLSQDELLTAIATNTLLQSDILDFRVHLNTAGATQTTLSQFSILGNEFDPASEFQPRADVGTWAVLLQDNVDGALQILALGFLNPVEGGPEGTLSFSNSTTQLDFDADLGQHLVTGEGLTYTLDWSQVRTQASGQTLELSRADRVFVGHLPVETDEDVEANFVQIYEMADAIYQLDVYGRTSVGLAEALDSAGTPFPGFTAGGAWFVGLECTTCTSPAPVILSRVDVR